MRRIVSLLLVTTLGAGVQAVAQPVPGAHPVALRGDFSGTWFHPDQRGHGLFVEVLDHGQAALAWFTFDPTGAPVWIYGLADVRGTRLVGTLSTIEGGHFPPAFDADAVTTQPWGDIELHASGCDSAAFSWTALDPAYGSGSLSLTRLTSLQGQRCNAEEEFGEQRLYSFERGPLDFEPVFADLPADGHDIYELDWRWGALPAPLEARHGVRLTGHNRSDDLAMFAVAPLGGLHADALYRIELEVELASNVPHGCAGIGGSPGESVYVKLGASRERPQAQVVREGDVDWLRLNIDAGVQSQDGADAIVVGTVSTRHACEAFDDLSAAPWELKTLSTYGRSRAVRSDEQGRIWLLAGTDSGFEGLTRVYLTALRARLRRVDDGS